MKTIKYSINGKDICSENLSTAMSKKLFKQSISKNDKVYKGAEILISTFANRVNALIQKIAAEIVIDIIDLKINVDGHSEIKHHLVFSKPESTALISINVHIELDTNSRDSEVDELIEALRSQCPLNEKKLKPISVNYFLTRKHELN